VFAHLATKRGDEIVRQIEAGVALDAADLDLDLTVRVDDDFDLVKLRGSSLGQCLRFGRPTGSP
jgi:hypothetical protein